MQELYNRGGYWWAYTRQDLVFLMFLTLFGWLGLGWGGVALLREALTTMNPSDPPPSLRSLVLVMGGVGVGVVFFLVYPKLETLEIPERDQWYFFAGCMLLPVVCVIGSLVAPIPALVIICWSLLIPICVWLYWYLAKRGPLAGDVEQEARWAEAQIKYCQKCRDECREWLKQRYDEREAQFQEWKKQKREEKEARVRKCIDERFPEPTATDEGGMS